MIIFDTETTGLIENEALPLEAQPRILELGALRVDFQLNVIEEFSALIAPPGYRVSDEIRAITGITQEELDARGRPFPLAVLQLARLFREDDTLMAHNLRFDLMMLVYELRRIDWQFRFPFPTQHIDSLTLFPGKLSEWGEKCGWKEPQRHRALDDCRLLLHCYATHVAEEEAKWNR